MMLLAWQVFACLLRESRTHISSNCQLARRFFSRSKICLCHAIFLGTPAYELRNIELRKVFAIQVLGIDIYTLFHVKTRPRATFQSCGGVKTTIALKCRQKYKKRFNFIFPFMFCGFAISIMLLSWPRAVKFYFISVKPG